MLFADLRHVRSRAWLADEVLDGADGHLVLLRLDEDGLCREILRDRVQLIGVHVEHDGVLDFG